MATVVQMRHRDSGIIRKGFFGFSWTTLFFGFFPALFRGDYITFIGGLVIYAILSVPTFGIGGLIAGLVWAFIYNKYYTRKLLERGYELSDSEAVVREAKLALGVA